MTKKYYHLTDTDLQEVYDELTDEQKLTLCLRDFRLKTVDFVAYRLGIDTDDLKQSFQHEYEDLLEEVDCHCLDILEAEELKAKAEDVIEECALWLNWMSNVGLSQLSEYIRNREDNDD